MRARGQKLPELEPLSRITGEGDPACRAGWVKVNAGKHPFDLDH
jgi:hypothetical protein